MADDGMMAESRAAAAGGATPGSPGWTRNK